MASKNPNSLSSRITDLAIGESLVLRLGDTGYKNARTYASMFGMNLGRRYGCAANRAEKTFTITRYE